MRPEALFLNGVYEDVLKEILQVQETLPEHILFLQHYKSEANVRLREEVPSVDNPSPLATANDPFFESAHRNSNGSGRN
jgi:hypothetical protein